MPVSQSATLRGEDEENKGLSLERRQRLLCIYELEMLENLGLCKNTPLNNITGRVNQWLLPQWI